MFFASNGIGDEVIEEVIQNDIISQLIDSVDWRALLVRIIVTSVQIMVAIIVYFILKKLGNYFIETAFKRHMSKQDVVTNRFNTLYKLSKNIFRGVMYFFLIYTILELMGVPVGTLVAGAGVLGLAVSLGAQGFVSDIVNGMMILFERQIDIGDVVELAGQNGVVVDVNLKTTKIKDFDGTIHYVPNRNVSVISNKSKGDMRALIKIQLLPGTSLDHVRSVIQGVNDQEVHKNDSITVPPAGVMFLPETEGGTVAQVVMFTKAGKEFATQGEYYERYMSALTEAGLNTSDLKVKIED